MNLIEQLGGYEKTKDHRDYLIDFGNEFNRPNLQHLHRHRPKRRACKESPPALLLPVRVRGH